jgi:hypothetical protein
MNQSNRLKTTHNLAKLAWMTCTFATISLLFTWGMKPAMAGQPPLVEIQITADEIIDNEYDQDNARFTFTDRDGNLWIGYYDKSTGAFYPPNGHGLLVDTGAAFSTDFGNGPEWAYSQQGPEIVYTKYLAGKPLESRYAGIAKASAVNGSWSGGFLPNGGKFHSPIATLNRNDPYPLINFQDVADTVVYWSAMDVPTTQQLVPNSDRSAGSRRFVSCSTCPDANPMKAIIFTAQPPGSPQGTYPQVFLYHTDTSVLEQLTSDNTSKMGAFMWRAPEYNNDYVFFTMVSRTNLVVYRNLAQPDGSMQWAPVATITAPTTLPYIWSPEPFVYNGRSFIFFQIGSSNLANDMSVPTQIAMSGIGPGPTNFRMLTNDSTIKRVRMDPEVVFLDGGPSIYYNRYLLATSSHKSQQDGIWRADTGLGPPISSTH